MSCALTSNIALACKDSVGGIKKIYVTELENKLTITATAGAISAFTLSTGKKFWVYDFEKETAEASEKLNPSADGSGTLFYEGELKIKLNKRSAVLRNELHLLAQNRLMIIILDRNGVYWLMGEENGADLAPSTSTFGKALGDHNGYELSFMSKEAQPMQTVGSGLIAALIVAAS